MKKSQFHAYWICTVLLIGLNLSSAFAGPGDAPPSEDHIPHHIFFADLPSPPRFDTTITGTVVNEKNEPLVGATVVVKRTNASASTNDKGVFSLSVQNTNATLVVSYIGYLSQEIRLNNNANVTITLVAETKALEDVVVIGYGTRKKGDVTGSTASLSSEKIRSVPVTNVTQALQGRVAGVEAMASSFRPGNGSRIRIRGNRSLSASNEPLYVVDGIPVSYTIDDMNPLDIETIDVLKDASATAIYGVRGANGVIQITTKKGKAGKVSIDYSGSVSFDNLLKDMPVFNAPELMDAWRQAFHADKVYNFAQNTSQPNNYYPNAAADINLFDGDVYTLAAIKAAYQWRVFDRANNIYIAVKRPTTQEEKTVLANLKLPVLDSVDLYDPSKVKGYNWQDGAIRQGITNSHNISITAGSDKIRASFNAGYFNQKGIEYGQDYTRYTVGNNTEFKPAKFLTFGNSITYSNSVQNIGPSMYGGASGQLPFAQPYDSTGKFILYAGGDQNIVNPMNDVNTVFNEMKVSRIFGNVYGEVNLFKGLRYKAVFGIDSRNTRQGQFNGSQSSVRQGGAASASHTITNSISWVYDNLLYYDFKIKKDHSFNITLLHEMQNLNKTDVLALSANNLIFEEQKWYSLNRNTLGVTTGSGSYSAQQLLSYMGRIDYNYKNKYYLTLSNRYDNSSVLAEGSKGQWFPSAAVAWRLDNEAFFMNQHVMNAAKLRVGYGLVGNSSIPPYRTNGPLDFTNYNWTNGTAVVGLAPTTFKTPGLTWEKTATINAGFDFGLFGNRISGSVDVYKSSTTDQLQEMRIPSANGVSTMFINLGEVSNKGIDVSLSSVNINTGGFTWTTDIVFSKNKESIVTIDGTNNSNLLNLWIPGQPIRVYYNYVSDGIYQYGDTAKGGYLKDYLWTKGTNAANTLYRPGKIRVRDINGDTLLDANDKTVLGYDNADWTGSITNTFSYKNFEVSCLIYVRKGGMYRVPRPGLVGRFQSNKVNYWTPTNPSNEYQQPTRTSDVPTYWEALGYRDGSFVRIRNISLTYRVPQSLLSKVKANSMSVYINAVNPFLIHNKSPYDPETIQYTEQFNSTTNNPGPNSYSFRSFVVGVRLGL